MHYHRLATSVVYKVMGSITAWAWHAGRMVTTCRECGAPGHITPGGGQLNLCTTHLEENKERAKKKRAETQKPLLCWTCPKGRKRPGYRPKHGGQKRLCKKHAYG